MRKLRHCACAESGRSRPGHPSNGPAEGESTRADDAGVAHWCLLRFVGLLFASALLAVLGGLCHSESLRRRAVFSFSFLRNCLLEKSDQRCYLGVACCRIILVLPTVCGGRRAASVCERLFSAKERPVTMTAVRCCALHSPGTSDAATGVLRRS